jgi:hypothetical protein
MFGWHGCSFIIANVARDIPSPKIHEVEQGFII